MQKQPSLIQWMAQPSGIPGCPPGLEYLYHIDYFQAQKTGYQTSKRFTVRHTFGQKDYFASEESNVCPRQCCRSSQGFTMHITDNAGMEVIRVKHDCKCLAQCQWCACITTCAHETQVEAPVGQVVGYIQQQWSCIEPRYSIHNAVHGKVLTIMGPCCATSGPCCICDKEFLIHSPGFHDVGKISKYGRGLMLDRITISDNFEVSFPMDPDVNIKAVILGAVFLIDFMFNDQSQPSNNLGL